MPKLSEVRFNEKTAMRAKPRDKMYELRDLGYRGLVLRVFISGSKRYIYQYARGKRITLGDASKMTLTVARQQCTNLQKKLDDGESIKRPNQVPLLEEFVKGEYQTWALEHQKDGRANVDRVLKACAPLMKRDLDDLSQIHIERWKTDRLKSGIKPSTVNRDLQGLKSVLNRAVEWQAITESPAANVKRVRIEQEHRVRYLEEEECKRLLAALKDRDDERRQARISGIEHAVIRNREPLKVFKGTYTDYLHPLVILVMNTGLRRSEALSLTWSQVRLADRPLITVKAAHSKSGKTRRIPLNDKAVNVLARWKKQGSGQGLVFTHQGKRILRVDTAWRNLMAKAKLDDFNFHDMRHDFASQLVMKGVDLYTVRELLGHGSIEMTQRYAHLAPGRLHQAVRTLDDTK